ncbi:hypothetical protein ACFYT3_31245 [Nocardia amikacinitolerans]
MRIDAVHRHHTVLSSDTLPGVLLPLVFIESIQRPYHRTGVDDRV